MISILITVISGVLGGGAFAFVQFLIERKDKHMAFVVKADLKPLHDSIDLLKNGHLVLMRDTIVRDCKKFLEDGQIGVMEASVLVDMMTTYKALGGNGFAEELYKQVKKLPLIK